jgi:toxin ParE1/3/4
MLSQRRHAGPPRPELGENIRSFPVGNYILFYKPLEGGIELVRVLSRYRDIDHSKLT